MSGDAKVSFVFEFYFRHWQHQSRHLVTIPKDYTYEALAARVKNLFSDEIGKSMFRLYSMPGQCDVLEDRCRLTPENFRAVLDDLYSPTGIPRNICVSNDDSSPLKLPAEFDVKSIAAPMEKLGFDVDD